MLRAGAFGVVAVVGAALPVTAALVDVGAPAWSWCGVGTALTGVAYGLHRRALATAVERARIEVVAEIAEIGERVVAGPVVEPSPHERSGLVAGLPRPRQAPRPEQSRTQLERVVSRLVAGARSAALTGYGSAGLGAGDTAGSRYEDPLTGLPNRTALLRLAAEAVQVAGPDHPLSVLVIDLDRFKDVNDSLGHLVGDHLLARVGPRLRAVLRPTDTIARLGGDEFAVLLPTAGQDGARVIADRLVEAMDPPFEVDGIQLHVEASIGIAVSHRGGRTETTLVEGLLREADIAMYRAKDERSVVAQFDPERDGGQNRSRLELSAQLRRAIAEDQLVLHYQPLVDVFEGRLVGVEALVRWQHPERGLLPPGVFLPLAESTGLIVPLSRQVLTAAVAQAASWRGAGHPVAIAVNLSPRWLQHSDIPRIVSALLEEHAVPPELIRLEITESVVLSQREHALGQLEQLRAMGIGLSLDDFGTGYSSMTHLRNLPVDELKVDRGFVHAMTTSQQDAVIVRAAIELGHNLGMDVVAEGIEDADTLAEVV
ncbi:MAG TPA: EAL domain-containing protein, partial [Kineosporiaceae bacterium]